MTDMSNEAIKKKKRKTVEYGRYGIYFILPFFLVYIFFNLYPLIDTFRISLFENYSRGISEVGPNFVGFDNFKNIIVGDHGLFKTETFEAVYNTVVMWVINFIPQILLSLVLASWFTNTKIKLKGQGAYKVIMYMPNIITAATIATLFYTLFAYGGPITMLLRDWGIISKKYDFMQSPWASRLLVAFMQFWMWYGNTTIVLIAGILGINPSLFEAARVDGASGGQIFRYITLPLLKPILLFTLVTSAVGGLQMYDIPATFNVNAAGEALPDGATQTITMLILRLIRSSKNYGKAAAVSIVLFVITFIVSILFFVFLGDKDKKEKKRKKGA